MRRRVMNKIAPSVASKPASTVTMSPSFTPVVVSTGRLVLFCGISLLVVVFASDGGRSVSLAYLSRFSLEKNQSPLRGSNSRPSVYKTDALSTELRGQCELDVQHVRIYAVILRVSNRSLMCKNRLFDFVFLGIDSVKSAPFSHGVVTDVIVQSYLDNNIFLLYNFFDKFSLFRSF